MPCGGCSGARFELEELSLWCQCQVTWLVITGGLFRMGVVLPGWADELLDLIGVSWPNVDEDDYREMANAMREFADDIDEGSNEAHGAIQNLVSSAGGSVAVEALNAHWGKVNGKHLKNLAGCGRMAGTAMDGVATLIEGAKLGALVQLGILAAEVIAAQAAAPFTFGLSELGALGATQVTRIALKRLFKEACQQVAEQVVSVALTPVEEALAAMVGDLVVQLGANALGVQTVSISSMLPRRAKKGSSRASRAPRTPPGPLRTVRWNSSVPAGAAGAVAPVVVAASVSTKPNTTVSSQVCRTPVASSVTRQAARSAAPRDITVAPGVKTPSRMPRTECWKGSSTASRTR